MTRFKGSSNDFKHIGAKFISKIYHLGDIKSLKSDFYCQFESNVGKSSGAGRLALLHSSNLGESKILRGIKRYIIAICIFVVIIF